MQETVCLICHSPKAKLNCGLCAAALCKYCAQLTGADHLAYLDQVDAELKHSAYCPPCFDENVQAVVLAYEQTLEAAKDVMVFDKSQGKETRRIQRSEDWIEIQDCEDRNEVLMRLAFFAAKNGFNGLVDVDINSRKEKTGSYQRLIWFGTGRPAQIHEGKLLKDKSLRHYPN